MRVISGTARGVRLETAEGLAVRPTIDRVKEAVFSSLFDKVRGAAALDLFAGSGQLGVEALSRGAKCCLFCEKDRLIVPILKRNVERARVGDRAAVAVGDFAEVAVPAARRMEKQRGREEESRAGFFDLVFLDPPFGEHLWEQAVLFLEQNRLLADGAVIVAECDVDRYPPERIGGFGCFKTAKYGKILIKYYSSGEKDEDCGMPGQF